MVIGPNSRHTMVSRRQFFALNNSTNNLKDLVEVNLVLLGALGVGKSALTVRFITRRFIMEYDPTLEDTFTKNTQIDGHDVSVKLMDTYDQESRSPERYLKWAHGYLIVYSITDVATFEAAKAHLATVSQHLRDSARDKPVALIGNKMDLERYRTVSKASGEELANQYDCMFHETSAAEDCDSVEEAFTEVVREIYRQRERQAQLQPLFISEDKAAGVPNGAGRGTSHFRRTKSPKSSEHKEVKDKEKDSKTLPRRTGSTFKILKGFKLFN